ncbi:MAG TPA: succinate dehydrogenase, hydrophobic membrane anchor protein [Methylocella sp.]|nr:succinate dehydrogenase, hydrophobic membrane anchor protein [Methylocella sp.]
MGKNPSSRQSEANKARFSGSARSGTADAWQMRVTSVALIPLSIAFVVIVVSLAGKDYAAARAQLANPLAGIILLLFILFAIFHMKLGLQSIIDDYVHDVHLKEWSLLANLLFSIAIGLSCVYAVLKLGFTWESFHQ